MNFRQRVTLLILAIGLLPALLVTAVLCFIASQSLEGQIFNQLTSIRSLKESELQRLLSAKRQQLANLQQALAGQDPDFQARQPYFERFIRDNGYYDLFVIDGDGLVAYSVTKEPDYRSNLVSGPYKDSGLAATYRQVRQGQAFAFADFAPYAPSNGEPAAFLGVPLGQERVLALQLDPTEVNAVMQLRAGMGETGEAYLVGSDKRMRSDSFLAPKSHSLKASFAGTLEQNGVDTRASRQALAGNSGTELLSDYNGNPVLSSYAPVEFAGVRWALIAEMDEAEALGPVHNMRLVALVILGAALLVVGLGIMLVIRWVIRPLGNEPDEMKHHTSRLASGDLSQPLEPRGDDSNVHNGLAQLQQMFIQLLRRIQQASHQLRKESSTTTQIADETSSSIVAQSQEVELLASAIEQMSLAAGEISANAVHASQRVDKMEGTLAETARQVEGTKRQVENTVEHFATISRDIEVLDGESQKISDVVGVIANIAEQTNLLALNAAIEAARAGEQGRGFAIVADEVRKLATRVQEATEDIGSLIGNVSGRTSALTEAMHQCNQLADQSRTDAQIMAENIPQMVQALKELGDAISQTATASEQQSQVAKEIAQNVTNISVSAQQNSKAASQVSEASQHLAGLSKELATQLDKFRLPVEV
ncbi:methyl-accepting chemotaxis protein [Gallaecimonas sp. GXIMD4217]|uniref:methyl-accepting chemotaxis protein n=1 Tax=Gallaecimonas sp. GXIMD4217 TaxID=3131927 RepID=UPI00311AE382